MPNVTYVKGTGENVIQIVDWTPAVDTPVGTVVVVGDIPGVSMTMGRNGGSALAGVLASLRIGGGVYAGVCADAVVGAKSIYWDDSADKFTLQAAGNKHFGFSVPDTNSAANDTIQVVHQPNCSPSSRLAATTVAAAGSVQGDAAALSAGYNHVTGADATKGVILPTPYDGMQVVVDNDSSANAILKVWPTTGKTINALAADGAISMAAKAAATFVYRTGYGWSTIPKVPS